ncbi:MAG: HAD-IA family hydrolase [Acinetobacter sp.]
MKILFTSVGRRVELIQAFKAAADRLGIDLMIYGVDFSDDAPALFFCDRQIKACRISNPDYIQQLIEICRSERINLLIPTIDTDLLKLAQNKDAFGNTNVVISDADKVSICRDKRLTANFFQNCGLLTPVPVDDVDQYKGTFPCFIKPLDGSSSINAYKVDNKEALKEHSNRIGDYIIQPFIDGKEYTIDAFCDFDGHPILITPRERIAVRSGEVLKTQICMDSRMIDECEQLIGKFAPRGAITVQLIRQKDTGDDYFIEINPRYGGGAPLSIKAGADSAEVMLRLAMGEQMTFQSHAAMNDAMYSRFDQSVCVSGGNSKITAVVFDLDDTLYSEKEYVMSGFLAIESVHPSIRATDLWSKFVEGKPVFEEYPNKAELLMLYRSHRPIIHLYGGVRELLVRLRKKGYKLGIITDGRPEGQRNKIEVLGLESLVDAIIVTDEIGIEFRKPCDIPFRIMQKRLHTPFDEMAYVGDNVAKDFIAPQKLGMSCIWVNNKDSLYSPCNNESKAGIRSVVELEGVL